MHVAPLSVLPYPALHVPAEVPPQPLLFALHVAQAVLPAAVLYVPAGQAVHVTPLSGLSYPALQVPAEVPPQPLLFALHIVQAVLPAAVLYVPAGQAVHVTPLSGLSYPALQVPAEVPPQPLPFASHVLHSALPEAVLYVPAAQAAHVLVPVSQYSPPAHSDPPRPVQAVEWAYPTKYSSKINTTIIIFIVFKRTSFYALKLAESSVRNPT